MQILHIKMDTSLLNWRFKLLYFFLNFLVVFHLISNTDAIMIVEKAVRMKKYYKIK